MTPSPMNAIRTPGHATPEGRATCPLARGRQGTARACHRFRPSAIRAAVGASISAGPAGPREEYSDVPVPDRVGRGLPDRDVPGLLVADAVPRHRARQRLVLGRPTARDPGVVAARRPRIGEWLLPVGVRQATRR